jgi:NAD(P)-dependent dehydrogenase (short-subunit alcohol dehydrogenase family)
MFLKDSLKDKRILVTGGGSGLGLAMGLRFAELGAAVAICGRSETRLAAAEQELKKHGGLVRSYPVDVRDAQAVAELFTKVDQDFGGVTSLVNNAAGNFYCAAEDLSPNAFKTVVDIVLHGTFNCTMEFGRRCIAEQRPGAVLSIVTTYTETGSAFVLPSACAKAGVYALTNSLAYEWAPYKIRLNSIAPGPFPTEGAWKRLVPDPTLEDSMRAMNPMGRFGEPEELANLATFLLSDAAGFINGECVTIDGGERLRSGQFNFLAERYDRPALKQIFSAMKGATKSPAKV